MRKIGDTLERLKAIAKRSAATVAPSANDRLVEIASFGSNPGKLEAWSFVPSRKGPMPLVVVLHGCTQNAAGYDHGSGWSTLADRHGFALLYPQQQRSNNPNLCFNWFVPGDIQRGGGEALSIRQMIAKMAEQHPIDPDKVFITGLSAGGAMTSVMLATYPELFAGGAIIAGLPFAAAHSVPEAFDRMRGHGHVADSAAAALVRGASRHKGPWPTISVWQGTADATVDPSNADAIIGQWRSLHGANEAPDREERVDGQVHRVWLDNDGREAIEEFLIAGLGHGTPIATTEADAVGRTMSHMIEAGISSTRHIAQRWGLLGKLSKHRTSNAQAVAPAMKAASRSESNRPKPVLGGAIQDTIESALRSAGLMR